MSEQENDIDKVLEIVGFARVMEVAHGAQSMETTQQMVEQIGTVVRIGDGLTLLHTAAQADRVDVTNFLLKRDPPHPLEMKTNVGETALDQAAWRGSVKTAEALLKGGANANCQTNMGYSPLHRCAFYVHPALAYILLKNGANPDLRDFEDKETPYQVAVSKGNVLMEQILRPGNKLEDILLLLPGIQFLLAFDYQEWLEKNPNACSTARMTMEALHTKINLGYGTSHFLCVAAMQNHVPKCSDCKARPELVALSQLSL